MMPTKKQGKEQMTSEWAFRKPASAAKAAPRTTNSTVSDEKFRSPQKKLSGSFAIYKPKFGLYKPKFELHKPRFELYKPNLGL